MPWKWKPESEEVEAAFAAQRAVDPFGHRLHTALAVVWCVLACGPVSVIEFGWAPLALCFLTRYPRHQGTHRAFKRLAVCWAILGWAAWQGLSVQWSPDRRLGLEEWGAMRFAVPVLLLWPVLDRRGWLIAGVGAGLLLANLAQVSHALGRAFDLPAITFDRLPNRNSGWWQPVVGGTMLTAGIGLHLPAALTGRGRARLLGVAGLVASLAGVLATGSRGAWLATGALVALGIAWALRRSARRAMSWGQAPFWLAVIALVGVVGYKMLGPTVRARAGEGAEEIRRVLESGDYNTFTGARIQMARWGVEAFADRPIAGIGAGGYKSWVAQQLSAAGKDPALSVAHAHAHNTFVQVAATTGLVGLVLFGAVVVLSVRGGFSRAGRELRGYEAGPAFALLGMLLVTPFDVINVNAQTAALWWILVAMCLWGRPREVISDEPSTPSPHGVAGGE